MEDLSASYPKPRGLKALNYVIAYGDSSGASLVVALTALLSVLSRLFPPFVSILPHLHLLYFHLPSPGQHFPAAAEGLGPGRAARSMFAPSHFTNSAPVWSHLLSVPPSQGCLKWHHWIVLFPQSVLLELHFPFLLIHKVPGFFLFLSFLYCCIKCKQCKCTYRFPPLFQLQVLVRGVLLPYVERLGGFGDILFGI